MKIELLKKGDARLKEVCQEVVDFENKELLRDSNHRIMNTISDGRVILGYLLDALTLCVTIIVVSVPEGLPMMITLVLSSNMKRMLKDNVLVRKLVGIETAGNINVLFTDKTGTLTKGKLEVVGFLDGCGNEINSINEGLRELFNMSIGINNASTYDKVNNKIIGGNITDKALLNYVKEYKCNCSILKREEFNSKKETLLTNKTLENKKSKGCKWVGPTILAILSAATGYFIGRKITIKN